MATYVPPYAIADEALRHEIILEQCKACPVVGKPVRAWHATVTTRGLNNYQRHHEETFTAYIVSCGVESSDGYVSKKHLVAQVGDTWKLIPQDTIKQIEPFVDPVEVERIKTKIKAGA